MGLGKRKSSKTKDQTLYFRYTETNFIFQRKTIISPNNCLSVPILFSRKPLCGSFGVLIDHCEFGGDL